MVNLTEICVDTECLTQNWVNNLGIWATLVSTIAAILVARAADAFKGRLKEFLVGLLLSGAVVFLFLSLISIGTIQFGSLAAVKVSDCKTKQRANHGLQLKSRCPSTSCC